MILLNISDDQCLDSSSNWKSSTLPSVERRHQLRTADSVVQRLPLNQSTGRRCYRLVQGVTQVDNKIFVLYDIREDDGCEYGDESLLSVIDVFSDRRPFERLQQIKINELKDPRDMVACCETFQLFVSGLSGEIWRVDIKTNDCQQFVKIDDGVRSLSLTSRRLLVTSCVSGSLHVFDVMNGEKLQFIELPKPTFHWTYHAIESNNETFFVSHRNGPLDSHYYEVSEINSVGHVIRSSGRQLGLHWPRHLAFDSIGRLLVTDSGVNGRILLLNEELKLERVLLEYEKDQRPYRLNYNKKTNQLIVGFDGSHFVNVYNWK